jgi:hypothetical protein
VNKQLQGILLSAEVLTPSTIKYELEERATVAKLFFECHDDLKEIELFQMRMEIIRNLICWISASVAMHKVFRLCSRLCSAESLAADCKAFYTFDVLIIMYYI